MAQHASQAEPPPVPTPLPEQEAALRALAAALGRQAAQAWLSETREAQAGGGTDA